MSIAHTAGRFLGQTAAYAVEGTRLASTQFAAGAQQGYAERAAELRAARIAALRGQALPVPEAAQQAAKVRVRTAKA